MKREEELNKNYAQCFKGGEKRKIIFTKEQVEQIIQLHNQGLSTKKIGDKIGYSHTTIARVLRENGIGKPLPEKVAKTLKGYDLNTVQPFSIDCNRKGRMCIFRAGSTAPNLCDYILMTGHSRGCDPHNCTKYIMRGSKNGKR